jgi:uncharacterized membrane protein HdeD (DUF308 family)
VEQKTEESARQRVVDVREEARLIARDATSRWWIILAAGIAWLLLAWVVLRLDIESVVTVGILIGATFVAAAVNELFFAQMVSRGWRFLHYALGALFILGSVWGFVRPVNTVFALASVLGLILFVQGAFEIARAVSIKELSELWWLGLVTGVLEILLAFWVSQRLYPARITLILVWVGFMAMFRGFGQISLAFAVRRAGKELAKV